MHDANAPAAATPAPSRPLIASTWDELRRRKVVRAAISYAVVAFVALQLAEITFDPLGLPPWAMTWAILAAVLGFPVVLVLAWYFDATAHGIERAPDSRTGPARLFIVGVVVFAVAGVGWWLTSVYRPGKAGRAAGDAPPNSIAVLPFEDLSAARDQTWFADGIAEELLDRLARVPGLRVAARTSSFAFRGKAADVKDIGTALDVGLVLEGSVRKAGERVRVTAQLIDTSNGYHVWSQTYDRPEGDIFALQDEITTEIAEQLKVQVAARDSAATGAATTVDVRAHEKYLEGRLNWRKRTPAALDRAVALFREALEIDPDFARAWSGLADAYLLQADYGSLSLDEAVQLAEPAIVKALALDPQLGEAWASLGLLRMSVGMFEAAEGNLEQAMKLDPRYEMAPTWLSRIYGLQGRFAEQRTILEQALAINPLEPVVNVNLALTQAGSGDMPGARTTLGKVLAITPGNDMLLRSLAGIELQAGRLDEAVRAARRAVQAEPESPANVGMLIDALAAVEDYDAADALVGRLPEGSPLRLTTRQLLAVRRGNYDIVPDLAEAVGKLMGAERKFNPTERGELLAAGLAHLLAGRDVEAAALLRAVCGRPENLTDEIELGDPGSLLLVALHRTGATEEAKRWEDALRAGLRKWIDTPITGANTEYVRALVASLEGRDADALAALERAYTAGFRQRWLLANDPRLEPVRANAGIRQLEARIAADLARMRAALAADQRSL